MISRAWSVALALMVVLGFSPMAAGHPLGNFSVNQYFMLDLRGEQVDIYYLLDIAEIPSFRELDALDANLDEQVSREEITNYLDIRVPKLFENISFTRDGEAVPLDLVERKLALLQGTGSLAVVNIVLKMRPVSWTWPEDDAGMKLALESANHEQDRGVRECLVMLDRRFKDQTIQTVPPEEIEYQTLVYEDENLNPVYQALDALFIFQLDPGTGDVIAEEAKGQAFTWTSTARAAQAEGEMGILLGFEEALDDLGAVSIAPESVDNAAQEPSQIAAAPQPEAETPENEAAPTEDIVEEPPAPVETAAAAPPNGESGFTRPDKGDEGAAGAMMDRVTRIIRTKELTPGLMLVALAIAMAMGMGHALSPGHGKTVMAAYLIGERGTIAHAIILGLVVTLTHTWSVILLGLVALSAGEQFSETQLSFWAGVASGLIIVFIGVMLFKRRYASYVLATQAAGGGGLAHGHGHDHEFDHEHGEGGHEHVAVTEDGSPPTYWNIIGLGISGGIVPCPAALIVLLLAINLGRLALGLGLLLSFSVGLAAVLVAIGIAVVKGAGFVRNTIGARSPALALLPVLSSVLITILGAWLVVWTLLQFDVLRIAPLG